MKSCGASLRRLPRTSRKDKGNAQSARSVYSIPQAGGTPALPIARRTIKLTYNYLMKNGLTQCDSIDYITQGIPKIRAALRRYHIYTRTL